MQAIDALKSAMKNYANFSGRAARGDYWWYVLAYVVVGIVLSILDGVLFGGGSASMDTHDGMRFSYQSGILATVWSIVNIVPSISLSARRLHDTNRSGWMQLIVLIPLLGWLYLLYLFVSKGDAGDNRFGPDPLA